MSSRGSQLIFRSPNELIREATLPLIPASVKIFGSLTTKLIFSFLFLVVLISGLTFLVTLRSTRGALLQGLRFQLTSVAGVMASQVNGDIVSTLKPGDEVSGTFRQIRDQLRSMRRSNPEIKYAYIMRATAEGNLEFAVDDTYGLEEDAAAIGEQYESEGPNAAQDVSEILSGLQGPTAATQLYTDRWGTFLSGYAPVLDSRGKAIAVLGVDMAGAEVQERQDFLSASILGVGILGIIVATALVAIFSTSMSRDVRKVNEMIKELAKGGKLKDIQGKPVKRKDELGQLAQTVDMIEKNVGLNLPGDWLNKM